MPKNVTSAQDFVNKVRDLTSQFDKLKENPDSKALEQLSMDFDEIIVSAASKGFIPNDREILTIAKDLNSKILDESMALGDGLDFTKINNKISYIKSIKNISNEYGIIADNPSSSKKDFEIIAKKFDELMKYGAENNLILNDKQIFELGQDIGSRVLTESMITDKGVDNQAIINRFDNIYNIAAEKPIKKYRSEELTSSVSSLDTPSVSRSSSASDVSYDTVIDQERGKSQQGQDKPQDPTELDPTKHKRDSIDTTILMRIQEDILPHWKQVQELSAKQSLSTAEQGKLLTSKKEFSNNRESLIKDLASKMVVDFEKADKARQFHKDLEKSIKTLSMNQGNDIQTSELLLDMHNDIRKEYYKRRFVDKHMDFREEDMNKKNLFENVFVKLTDIITSFMSNFHSNRRHAAEELIDEIKTQATDQGMSPNANERAKMAIEATTKKYGIGEEEIGKLDSRLPKCQTLEVSQGKSMSR